MAKLLVEKGADLESKDIQLDTAIVGRNGGYEAVVKLLVEKGADLQSKDHRGQTPLSLATTYGHNKAVVKLLLEKGAKNLNK